MATDSPGTLCFLMNAWAVAVIAFSSAVLSPSVAFSPVATGRLKRPKPALPTRDWSRNERRVIFTETYR
jgi:hypothetical protein